jgi:serine/threonine protein kinase
MSSHALPVGTKLQGALYSIGRVLGQGGFGITYLGSDSGLKRPVAIKEFFPQVQGCSRMGMTVHPGGMISPADYRNEKDKFLAEGRRLARFQHPGIVKVFSLFEENNTAYMVMELLKGRTLLKMVEEDGPLDEREAVAYITQIAEALDVVHGSEILHRDVKPENVIIKDDGRAALVDFGTAREFAAGKTRRMTTSLTPGYAPLEQYGLRARFGVFTDIYALGATLYHLITGEMPIQATDRATGVELQSPRRVNPAVSPHISDAVMWALEMKVDARPQSVRDFLTGIRGTRPPSPARRSRHTKASSGPKGKGKDPRATGLVEIILSRTGPYAIDRPVTINVEKRMSRSQRLGQFEVCRSVTATREQNSLVIELDNGEHQFSATCTVAVRDQLVFATRILTSNYCRLVVQNGQTVTLRLDQQFDDLYLSWGNARPT